LKTKKEIMNVKVEICFPVTAKCFWAFLLSAFCFPNFCFSGLYFYFLLS